MRTLIVKITSPVSISTSPSAGNVNCTLDYLPGTAVRGALAANYLRHGEASDPTFQRLFTGDEVRYANLYPYRGVLTEPVPLTAYTCKRHPGFIADKDTPHGVFDLALDLLVWRETKGKAPVPEACRYEGTCFMPLDSFSGFCLFNEADQRYESVMVSKRQRGHTEISDSTQSALFGSLYFLEMLDEGQQFSGPVVGDKTLLDEIDRLLKEPLRLGVGQTRGLGECVRDDFRSLPLRQLEPIGTQNGQTGRLRHLNDAIQEKFKAVGQAANKLYFTLTCHSDLIVRDRFLRYLSHLPLDAIKQNLAGVDTTILSAFVPCGAHARVQLVSGWSNVWKLPKESAHAIVKGSVFVYGAEWSNLQCFDNKENIKSALAGLLEKLEQRGLGERRSDGFGTVIACDPFHYHRDPDDQLPETERARL